MSKEKLKAALNAVYEALAPLYPVAVAPKMSVAAVSYMYPSATPEKQAAWAGFCSGAKLVILNPDSGPGTSANADYVAQMAKCRAVPGLKVAGYVTTNYYDAYGVQDDNVPRYTLVHIKAEIDRLFAHYGHFDYIFCDEMNTSVAPDIIALHKELAAYIRAKGALVIQNPGTRIPESSMALADIVMNFEGSAASYRTKTFDKWTLNYPGRFWHCVHTCTAAEMPEMVALAKARGAGHFYACNVYNEFPVFWNDMVAKVNS